MSRHTRPFVTMVLALFIARAALAAEPATKPAATKTADFQNADKTFTFKYPADWDREDNPTKNTVVKLEPKDVGQGHASFMLLFVQPYRGRNPPDMKAAGAGFLKGQKNTNPDMKLVEQKEVTVAGSPAVETLCTNDVNGVEVKVRSTLIVHEKQIVLFQILAEPALYERLAAGTDDMLKSLEWTKR